MLGFPYVHLADPPNLAVPRSEREHAVGLRELRVASFVAVAETRPQAGQVEVQTVVVFRPTRTLEGDEFGVGIGFHFQTLVNRVRRVVFLELAVGIEFNSHLPNIVIDAARAEAEGVVVALHFVEADATEMTGIDSGMAPEQQRTTLLVPLADGRRGSLHVSGDVPHVALADAFEVAHPEQHAEAVNVGNRLHVVEADELGGGIVGVQPQPSRSLIVVAILHEFIGRSIDAQEADGSLTDAERRARSQRSAFVVDSNDGHFPDFASLHVGNREIASRSGECLGDGALAVGGSEADAGGIGSLVPLHVSVVAASLVELRHHQTGDARSTNAGVVLDDTRREVLVVGQFEHIFERNIRGNVFLRIAGAADNL